MSLTPSSPCHRVRPPGFRKGWIGVRPLLAIARDGDLPALRAALDAEVRAIQELDRQYWEPPKREMEVFRRNEWQESDRTP